MYTIYWWKNKHDLDKLTNIWKPEINYSFKEGCTSIARCFGHEWLSYSKKMKGPFGVFCSVFHSSSGHVNSFKLIKFIKKSCYKYNDFY